MEGTVKWFNPTKGYGFIVPKGGGPDMFVHRSALEASGLYTLEEGQLIQFEVVESAGKKLAVDLRLGLPAENASEGILLDSEDIEDQDTSVTSKDLTREVAEWKLEAKSEDNDRYFFHVKEVTSIEGGEKCYVIGRKGSGKTAISEYLGRLIDHDTFSEKLTFKNFPFTELYSLTNNRFTSPNQYITLWKYLIYSSICKLMARNASVKTKKASKTAG
jgi:cold shock CspA family protein